MRFKLIALSLLTMAATLFTTPVLSADTRIFSLERSGQPMGRVAIEVKANSGGAGQVYESQSRLDPSIGRFALLRHLIEPKQIVIDPAIRQKILHMTQNGTEWTISTKAPDIRIQRNENGRKVDDLAINPIRPVYDLLSLVTNLKTDTRQGSFDFYFLEKGHQKRLSVEKAGRGNWQIVYKEKPLADIHFDRQNLVNLTFRDSPYFPDLSGFELKELCGLRRRLFTKRSYSAQQIAIQWASQHRPPGVSLVSGLVQGRFDGSKALIVPGGLHLERDITDDVKRMILQRMRRARAIKASDADRQLQFDYNRRRRCFDPRIGDEAALYYSLDDLKKRIGVEQLNVSANRNNTGLICSFTERTCSTRKMPAYEVPIVKTYAEQIGYDGSNPEHAIRVNGDAQNVTIEAYIKGIFGGKTINSVQVAAMDFQDRLRIQAGNRLKEVQFDTGAFGKNPENLIILYSAEKCQSRQDSRVIEFGPEFEHKFGIGARYLRFKPDVDHDGWQVRAALKEDFTFCPFSDTDFLRGLFGSAIRTGSSSMDIRQDGSRYFITGKAGLFLTLEEISRLLDLPSDSKVKVSSGMLEVTYKDFSCNE